MCGGPTNVPSLGKKPVSFVVADLLVSLSRELLLLPGVCSAIVAGSVGRGEGSVLMTDDGAVLFGDVEILLVVERRIPSPDVQQALYRAASSTDGFAEPPSLEVNQVPRWRLSRLPRKLFVYEAREAGRCIGGLDLRSTLPVVSAASIDRWDLNEIYLHRLEALLKAYDPVRDTRWRWYGIVRNTLDVATWLLPYEGVLLPTYAMRARYLSEHPGLRFLEAMQPGFVERMARYTAYKLNPSCIPWSAGPPLAECLADLDAAAAYVRSGMRGEFIRRYARRRRILPVSAAAFRAVFSSGGVAPSRAAGWVVRDTLPDRTVLARTILGWIAGESRSTPDEEVAVGILDRISLVPLPPPRSIENWRRTLLCVRDAHRGMI